MKTSKPVLDPNLGVFVQQVIDLAKQGWELDPQYPPSLLGFYYETMMVRDESIVDPPPKPTMAEVAAKGRAAKAAKKAAAEAAAKAGEQSEEDTQTSDEEDDTTEDTSEEKPDEPAQESKE